MTIKITAIQNSGGEIVLTISFDNPSGSGTMKTYSLHLQDLVDRLIELKQILGRSLTVTDARQVLVEIINEVRVGKTGIPEHFDLTPYIGVELET
jgi:hypothetical protein